VPVPSNLQRPSLSHENKCGWHGSLFISAEIELGLSLSFTPENVDIDQQYLY
jgi:hypothetical protein